MTDSKTRTFDMWGIRCRGKHSIFCAFEKSHHAIKKCEQLKENGIVCKIVKLSATEDKDDR